MMGVEFVMEEGCSGSGIKTGMGSGMPKKQCRRLGMKEIALTQGKVALVDDEDFDELSRYKWHARKDNSNMCYAGRNSEKINGRRHTIRMHWHIIGKPEKPFTVDHINGDGTDNQRSNLRIVSDRDNQCNRVHGKIKSSKYPGVRKSGDSGRFKATIVINGKKKHLGCYDSPEIAFESYKAARQEIGFPIQI
jgi:hypothetical protein